MSIIMCPEQKRGVLERGTAKLYLLELDRTVILSNVGAQPRALSVPPCARRLKRMVSTSTQKFLDC